MYELIFVTIISTGGWVGGQSKYVMIPYADFNALVIDAPRNVILDKILSIACLAGLEKLAFCGFFHV